MDSARRPVLLLPFWAWIVAAAGAGVIYLQTQMPDQGMANGFTWMTLVIAGLLLLLWFSFFSDRPSHIRMEVLIASVAAAGLFGLLFRVEGMTGNMIPILAWRFKPVADREAPGKEAEVKLDLVTTTPSDFPNFLGPQRDQSVSGLTLARDWSAHPPQEVWRRPVGEGWSGFAIVNGYAVTLEQHGPAEHITCYELATGKLMWSHSHQARYETFIAGVGPRSTPTIHQGKVYATGATGVLFCLDGSTGRLIWKKNLLQEFDRSVEVEAQRAKFGRSNSPLVVDDLVIVPAGGPQDGPALGAFKKDTGELVWKAGERNVSNASPVLATLAGKPQVLSVNENSVTGHDVKTGAVLWEFDWPGITSENANNSQPVPLPPDRVFLSKGYGVGSVLLQLVPKEGDALEPKVLWRNKVMRTKFTNVAIHDGHVYGLNDGILECINLETGKRVWLDGRYGHGQILRVNDLLLVLSEEGELLLVEATPERPNHILGNLQALDGKTWNNLALSGDLLLIRNAREAVCLRLKTE